MKFFKVIDYLPMSENCHILHSKEGFVSFIKLMELLMNIFEQMTMVVTGVMTPAPAALVPWTPQWTVHDAPCRPSAGCCPGLLCSSAHARQRCLQLTSFCPHKMCHWTATCHAELPPLDSRPSQMCGVTSGHPPPWTTITDHLAIMMTLFCLTT